MHSLQKLGHTVQLAQVLSANSRVCFNVWYNYICKSLLGTSVVDIDIVQQVYKDVVSDV